MALSIEEKLNKTRLTIAKHIMRGNTYNSQRSLDLIDRYTFLIETAKVEMPGEMTWRNYCVSINASPEHDGFDLFA